MDGALRFVYQARKNSGPIQLPQLGKLLGGHMKSLSSPTFNTMSIPLVHWLEFSSRSIQNPKISCFFITFMNTYKISSSKSDWWSWKHAPVIISCVWSILTHEQIGWNLNGCKIHAEYTVRNYKTWLLQKSKDNDI